MSGGFQPNGFQGPPGFQQLADVTAVIEQTLPALTQEAFGFVAAEEGGPGGGGMFLAPGFIEHAVAKAVIHQTLPALTQQAFGEVNDDELVLLLVLA